MASSSTRKQCANNDGCKQPAAVICEGCSQSFCIKHLLDHRRLLGEEMNVIISEHDQFQHILNQQTTNPDSHPLIKQVNDWEKESIVKIQQKAKELRQELLQLATVHVDELSKKLRYLSEKLKEGREDDSFVETDLQDWRKSLDDLKVNLALPSTFSISRHDRNPLVQNVSVNSIERNELFERVSDNSVRIERNELFERVSDNSVRIERNELFERVSDNSVRIEENGQVAIRNTSNNYTQIRGKNEYTSDSHEIRLCIEQSADVWTFLGIISKSTPLQNYSYGSKSAYGWTNNNEIWLNGSGQSNTSTSRIEMKTNDIILLIFDCDKRKISMINERTNGKNELNVNIDYCPLPWQLHVILNEPNSRVRILSA